MPRLHRFKDNDDTLLGMAMGNDIRILPKGHSHIEHKQGQDIQWIVKTKAPAKNALLLLGVPKENKHSRKKEVK